MKSQPLVSIGLPVYNGENYLIQAIESVLNQTYSNFELVISDNGSTDNTAAICHKFMENEPRIRYNRFEKNLGAAKNYNTTFDLSEGRYFKWLAHDDMIAPDSLTKAVEVLESNKDIVICGSAKTQINAIGEIIDSYDYTGLQLDDDDLFSRYSLLLNYFQYSFENADFVMGLMRSNILAKTNLIGSYPGSDFSLLAELSLHGKFHVIDEPLFLRRIHHAFSMSVHNLKPEEALNIDPKEKITYKSNSQVARWFDPEGRTTYIPHFKWVNELVKAIKKNQIENRIKMRLILRSYHWFQIKFLHSLVRKLKNYTKPVLN